MDAELCCKFSSVPGLNNLMRYGARLLSLNDKMRGRWLITGTFITPTFSMYSMWQKHAECKPYPDIFDNLDVKKWDMPF